MNLLYKWDVLLLIMGLMFYLTACGPKAIPYAQNMDALEPNEVAVAHYNWGNAVCSDRFHILRCPDDARFAPNFEFVRVGSSDKRRIEPNENHIFFQPFSDTLFNAISNKNLRRRLYPI